MGVRIDQLPTSLSPSLEFVFPAMKDGTTVRLTLQQVSDMILALIVDGSPAALDTLNELAAALGDDANFAATVAADLANRLRFDAAQTLTTAQKLQARTNLSVPAKVSTTVDNTIPRFDGTTGEMQGSGVRISDSNSMGVGVVPTGLLESGAGLALGDANTGIARPGAGVLDLIVNNGILARLTADGIELAGRSFMGQSVAGHDLDVVDVARAWVDFTAKGKSVFAVAQFYIDQTGGAPTPIFGHLKLRDVSNSSIVATGSVTVITTRSPIGNAAGVIVCTISFNNLTLGRAYRVELYDRKHDPTGPTLSRGIQITGICI